MIKTYTVKLIVLAIVLLVSASGLRAQDTNEEGYNSQVRFGVRAGVTISNQSFEAGGFAKDPESKFGGDLAVMANFPIGNGFFMLQPELHLIQKGYQVHGIDSLGDITSTLNYLELPVLLRFNFGGSLKLFAIGGPSVGYLLTGKYVDNGGSYGIDNTYYNELEFGFHVGAGIGLGPVEIDVRYMGGLTDISEGNPGVSGVKNKSFGAGITFKF